jgi:hypothetical protein
MTQVSPSKRGAHAPARPFHLFVYGTLTEPTVFRAVLGYRLARHSSEAHLPDTFLAREAVLAGYKKVSPDETYLYAVPDPQGRLRGLVVGPLPAECMTALLGYEGRNYRRVRVKVQTADGPLHAVAFVANLQELSHAFGWKFRDHLKQEVLLGQKIEKALVEDELARLGADDPLTRRALSELHGLTIRDLVRRHFEAGGISTFAIRRALREEPLREFGEVFSDPEARALAGNYLGLLLRQVLFNQIEARIREEFRYELDHMQMPEKFYERTISALAALRLLNQRGGLGELLSGDMLAELPPAGCRLLDYVRWSVAAADAVYEAGSAARQIEYIRANLGRGTIPLGAELEFSNIGHEVIRDGQARQSCELRYDGFLYFRDFGLDILTWKLGGHVDDHRVKSSPLRRRGFFELALGSLSVEANISKPITDDPWLLNQIIHAAMDFYDIVPHSLHISLQLRSRHRPVQSRHLPLGVLKCLFALAGGPKVAPGGGVVVTRLGGEEIIRVSPETQMLFSQISRRRSSEEDDFQTGRQDHWVQQFKFLRLDRDLNYEPVIMALKGLQIHYKPGSFLTAAQHRSKASMRQLFERLAAWGTSASPLGSSEIEEFLCGVYEGLLREYRSRPAHSPAYVAWSLAQLRAGLDAFNNLFSPRQQTAEKSR